MGPITPTSGAGAFRDIHRPWIMRAGTGPAERGGHGTPCAVTAVAARASAATCSGSAAKRGSRVWP